MGVARFRLPGDEGEARERGVGDGLVRVDDERERFARALGAAASVVFRTASEMIWFSK